MNYTSMMEEDEQSKMAQQRQLLEWLFVGEEDPTTLSTNFLNPFFFFLSSFFLSSSSTSFSKCKHSLRTCSSTLFSLSSKLPFLSVSSITCSIERHWTFPMLLGEDRSSDDDGWVPLDGVDGLELLRELPNLISSSFLTMISIRSNLERMGSSSMTTTRQDTVWEKPNSSSLFKRLKTRTTPRSILKRVKS